MPMSKVQPAHYAALLAHKVANVREILAEFNPGLPVVYPSEPMEYRLRAEFRISLENEILNYVMFRSEDPKTPVVVTDFPIGHSRIRHVMPALLEHLNADHNLRKKLFQVEFLATQSGELLVTLVYHRPLDQAWALAAQHLRTFLQTSSPDVSIIGRSRRQKLVLGNDYVQEVFSIHGREYRLKQYEQSFSQPNGQVNIQMIEWVCEKTVGLHGDLLELYCGNGNFTLPLSRHFSSVIATETSKLSVRAAAANIAENAVKNVHVVRLSAEEMSQAMAGTRPFRRLSVLPQPLHEFNLQTLFVDPPRAGLDDMTVAMAANFPTIIYMSCNPLSLTANLQSLNATHRIDQLALFDQFPYTDHMECGVLLKRRQK